MVYDDSDVRHWRFVYESLMDMNLKLQDLKAQVYIFQNEVQPVFQCLAEEFDIQNVFSHQEIGNKLTFDRDLQMQTFFMEKEINWKESRTNGIIRRLKNRSDWEKRCSSRVRRRRPNHPDGKRPASIRRRRARTIP